MFKTPKLKSTDGPLQEETSTPHEHPMVCLFDFTKDVEEELRKLRFNYVIATFGSTVKVDNKKYDHKLMKLNHDYPNNLHEFDIVMLDLTNDKSKIFDTSQHVLRNTTGNKAHAILSVYPEQVFDPRPFSINVVSQEIDELRKKKSIVIAFCGIETSSDYQLVEITSTESRMTRKVSYSNLTFYNEFCGSKARRGRKVFLPPEGSALSPLFNKHLDGIEYKSVFPHPIDWAGGKQKKDVNFKPLLLNERDEIVSYAHYKDDSLVLVFPDVEDKPSFVANLFKTYLPEIMPDIFPYHGEFGWLDGGDYLLPGESDLLQERAQIEEKYLKDISENENSILELKKDYKFLADLISETGDALVSSVEQYLKWLDFESVVNFDDTNPDTLEEDIQVDCGDRFLVVEVKGIGGTSTDKDCSQISKIKYRRAEQRNKFDVYGLYIVNHQRYVPPKSRSNPPFTKNQIKDAGHDKRGLLTTYDLYKAYFMIEEGILKKEDVRESLFTTGLITLEPENIDSIGIARELLMDGQVAIIELDDTPLAVGDTLIVKKQSSYSKVTIQSLQVNDEEVDICNVGEVGIKFDRKLKRNSELFIKKV
ncbi:hypothetical protein [Idiomarina abyssalis]|uniref:hypothetical protein n=1 Tax=Idiomarina abyssalis TaxID=86102 RepID=UPI001C93B3FF|nr:hypothetical protein [Idiomarina abyssalis]QZN92016.1 hypothetical protein K5X84_05820 [Idiomarina abyssalis]